MIRTTLSTRTDAACFLDKGRNELWGYKVKWSIYKSRALNATAAMIFAGLGLAVPTAGARTEGRLIEFPIDTTDNFLVGITAGINGEVWFTQRQSAKITRLSFSGEIDEFDVAAGSRPSEIVFGPQGAVWFTAAGINAIGRLERSGAVAYFAIPTPNSEPSGIAIGPDQNSIWFTEAGAHKIGRMTLDGVITEFDVPTAEAGPYGITLGPDNHLWFTEAKAARIGRVSPGGRVEEFPIPTPDSRPHRITAGPDGALWFTEYASAKIGRITLDGDVSEYATGGTGPSGIVAGPDGALWFVERGADRVAKITTSGVVTPYELKPGADPNRIVVGSDEALWFTQTRAIGRITSEVTEPNQPPSASFEHKCVSVRCTFTSTSRDDDGTLVSYEWHFGDESASIKEAPVHIYDSPGQYDVVLVVTDNFGERTEQRRSISVRRLIRPRSIVLSLRPSAEYPGYLELRARLKTKFAHCRTGRAKMLFQKPGGKWVRISPTLVCDLSRTSQARLRRGEARQVQGGAPTRRASAYVHVLSRPICDQRLSTMSLAPAGAGSSAPRLCGARVVRWL